MREMEYSINYLWDEGKTNSINNFVVGKKNQLAGLAVVCYVGEGGKWQGDLVSDFCTDRGYVVGFVARGRQ